MRIIAVMIFAIYIISGLAVFIAARYKVSKKIEELERYRLIGTVDECQEATERQKVKKPNERY